MKGPVTVSCVRTFKQLWVLLCHTLCYVTEVGPLEIVLVKPVNMRHITFKIRRVFKGKNL